MAQTNLNCGVTFISKGRKLSLKVSDLCGKRIKGKDDSKFISKGAEYKS